MTQLQSAASEGRPGMTLANRVLDKITVIADAADEAALIARATRTEEPLVISFVNQNAMTLAWRSPDYAACLIDSDILLRDGIGVELCLAAMGRRAGQNMCGTDFIPRLAAAFSGRRTAVFGTGEPWISRAAEALAGMGCQIVATLDGFRPRVGLCCRNRARAPRFRPSGDGKSEAGDRRKNDRLVGTASDGYSERWGRRGCPRRTLRTRPTLGAPSPLRVAVSAVAGTEAPMAPLSAGGLSFAWYLMRLRIAP